VQRRRDALDAARQSIAELQESRDVTDLLRVQQEWLAGSLHRVTSDLESLARIALDFSQRPIRIFVDASPWLGWEARGAGVAAPNAAGSRAGAAERREAQGGS
jgi:hypothetical protein